MGTAVLLPKHKNLAGHHLLPFWYFDPAWLTLPDAWHLVTPEPTALPGDRAPISIPAHRSAKLLTPARARENRLTGLTTAA